MDGKQLSKPFSKYSKRHIRRLINNTASSSNATGFPEELRLECSGEGHSVVNINNIFNITNLANIVSPKVAVDSSVDCSDITDTNYFGTDLLNNVGCNNISSMYTNRNFDNVCIDQGSKSQQFLKSLTSWAIKICLSHNAFNDLLNLLRTYSNFEGIPKDCRTLLKFDNSLKKAINIIPPGQYYHFGLKQGIIETVKMANSSVQENILKISINVDGLPLTKSSLSQFWPILASIDNLKNSGPFPVGIYHGKSKPENANDFLKMFVDEFQEIKNTDEGIVINSSNFQIKISKILCDAPAKSFVLNVKGHNSYSGCTKCKVLGEYTQHRMAYLNSQVCLRSHDEFVNMSDDEYHKGPTVLAKLGIDLINDVPLDYMHLVCLGVTKRLLSFWVSGHQGVRLFKEDIENINTNLEQIRICSVKEFARLPRTLKEIDRWKATEFRQFLLYYGPVVLKNILKEPLWSHFLSLHVAIRILISPELCAKADLLDYAENLLQYFVRKFGEIYGNEYVSHNVHNLIHLVNDVKKHGPLDNFSCFAFENYMHKIKKTLKTSNHPLKQYINRHYEYISHYSLETTDLSNRLVIPIGFKKIDSENLTIFKELIGPNFQFSVTEPNCYGFLKSNIAIQFLSFYYKQDKIFFECYIFNPLKSFYKIPCDSLKFNCGLVAGFNNTVKSYMIDDILCKAIKVGDFLLPLLHAF